MSVQNDAQVYSPGVDPKFLDGGKMSCHLDSLAIGDCIEAKGPMGHVTYLSCGRWVFGLQSSIFSFDVVY
jgi:Oxidoreductase FAD-binding domain